MSDLIDREHVIDFLKLTRDSEYEKSMSAEVKHKSVIRSKHDAHVAFCDYLIEYVKQMPTHPTPSNTLGALDVNGLEEEIRCTMCKNPNHTDRGCDGGCEYDKEVYEKIMNVLKGRISELPSVQPRTGKWIEDIKRFGDDAYHCSKCGAVLSEYDLQWNNNYFCYHCGADMRGDAK